MSPLAALELLVGIPFGKILRVGLVVAIVLAAFLVPAGLGWWAAANRYEGMLLRQANELNARIDQRNEVLEEMKASAEAAARARADLQRRYDEVTSRPPEVVVRYQERIRYVDRVIQAEDCPEAVGEAIAFVRELQELEEGVR